jgi:hypothetical protein
MMSGSSIIIIIFVIIINIIITTTTSFTQLHFRQSARHHRIIQDNHTQAPTPYSYLMAITTKAYGYSRGCQWCRG